MADHVEDYYDDGTNYSTLILVSPDGTKYQVTVENDGTLKTTAI